MCQHAGRETRVTRGAVINAPCLPYSEPCPVLLSNDALLARTFLCCVSSLLVLLSWCVQDPASSSTTMKVPPSSLSSDLMPFFQRDYVKANSDDVMRAFPRMLTDMALTLPTEVCPWGEWGVRVICV